MNRPIVILGITLALLAALGVGYAVLVRPAPQPPAGQQSVHVPNTSYAVPLSQTTAEAQGAVKSTFEREVAAGHPDNLVTKNTVVIGGWALQVWVGDVMGGEALFTFDTAESKWVLVDFGGGAWSVESLVRAGVPQDIAEALLAGRPY
ncbi:MAG: hypothetical protein AAB964_02745 [Patescibacteria group bacterium]